MCMTVVLAYWNNMDWKPGPYTGEGRFDLRDRQRACADKRILWNN